MTLVDPYAFREHRLPSGLRLLYQHRRLPFSGSRVLIHAGARRDPYGKHELMHVLEHLVGTDIPGVPSQTMTELQRWINQQRFNVMLGETTLDWTAFDGYAANWRFDHLLRFLRTMTFSPTLGGQLDKERDIVKRERDEAAQMYERVLDAARVRFAFGHKDPACNAERWGEDKHLDAITVEDVREAHRRWYHPANATLIVVGGLDENVLLKIAEPTFAPSFASFEAPPPPEPKSFERRQSRARKAKEDSDAPDTVDLRYRWYLPPGDGYKLTLVEGALSEALNERLREKMQTVYDAGVDKARYADHSVLSAMMQVKPEDVRRVRRAISEEISRLAQEMDVERHRNDTLLAYEFMEPDVEATLEKATYDLELYGRTVPLTERLAKFESLKQDEVREYAASQVTLDRAYIEIIER